MSLYFEDIELQDCPYCGGTGSLEEEGGWCLYVQCLDCCSHTAEFAFHNEAERAEAARQAAHIWNMGKVIHSRPDD